MKLLEKHRPVPHFEAWVAALGVFTAVLSKVYGFTLKCFVDVLWRTLPEATGWGEALGPVYTLLVCTLGGACIGLLGVSMSRGDGVQEYITKAAGNTFEACAKEGGGSAGLENSQSSLLLSLARVLLPALLTTAAGISLGPEAPMVVAGGLCGDALARRLGVAKSSSSQSKFNERAALALRVAGSSGALSAFLGMPLVGAVFVLELLSASSVTGTTHAGGHSTAAFAPAVAASVVASAVATILAVWASSSSLPHLLGGHLEYGIPLAVPSTALCAAALWGCVGGLVAAMFSLAVKGGRRFFLSFEGLLKHTVGAAEERVVGVGEDRAFLANLASSALSTPVLDSSSGLRPTSTLPSHLFLRAAAAKILVKASAGFAVGVLGVLWPHTVLWGETRLPLVLVGSTTTSTASSTLSAAATSADVLAPALWAWARVGARPYARLASMAPAGHALEVGAAKLVAIAVAAASGFPGGVVFPLFFAGACVGRGLAAAAPRELGVGAGSGVAIASLCVMAGVQAAATRTPLATSLLLAMAAGPGPPSSSSIGSGLAGSRDCGSTGAALFILLLVSSYSSVWMATSVLPQATAFFEYPPPPRRPSPDEADPHDGHIRELPRGDIQQDGLVFNPQRMSSRPIT
mmetsp:Transcript_78414/g.156858  ORF Transcript_78414/g.156858 Transcript_78414/m.156858 type:complete len:633 (-) Transcript_78414:133-2031(-)